MTAVFFAAGLDAELQDDLADLQALAVARVERLDDVRSGDGELRHARELARRSGSGICSVM
jgi:hypothetical protein